MRTCTCTYQLGTLVGILTATILQAYISLNSAPGLYLINLHGRDKAGAVPTTDS